ncbi:MAG: hypothetical protein ACJ704_09295 [Nitrososphaeraceae archaeon]
MNSNNGMMSAPSWIALSMRTVVWNTDVKLLCLINEAYSSQYKN